MKAQIRTKANEIMNMKAKTRIVRAIRSAQSVIRPVPSELVSPKIGVRSFMLKIERHFGFLRNDPSENIPAYFQNFITKHPRYKLD